MKHKLTYYMPTNLGLRNSARTLFTLIHVLSDTEVILDFTYTASISRGFAHEYLNQRKKSTHKITEINLSPDIVKMFVIVDKNNEFKWKSSPVMK